MEMPREAQQLPPSSPVCAVAEPDSDSGSLKDALDDDDNVLIARRFPHLKEAFIQSLEAKRQVIEAVACALLGAQTCHLVDRKAWKSGSFNIVLPLLVNTATVYMRIPLPYRLGEDQCPGNVDEKLRSEIATYIWLHQHCPDIPIPTLHGFGLPDGSTYTHPRYTPFVDKMQWSLKRLYAWSMRRSTPVDYVRRSLRHDFGPGFILISEARGKPLALSWAQHCHDKGYRERLQRSLARISLSLHATPLPCIGSLTLKLDDTLGFTRPLSVYFQMMENEGIPSAIPRERTYTNVEAYLSDLISFQDNKIRCQPNAVHTEDDGKMQMAALVVLRATMHNFIRPEYRDGPFVLEFTDLHQHNIFVDEDWNVTTIIDLEWAHTVPVEMSLPPYWFVRNGIDLFGDHAAMSELRAVLEEYWTVYAEEEGKRNGVVTHVPVQRDVWQRGAFWYFHALAVPKGMYNLFNRHIQSLYNNSHGNDDGESNEVFYHYWGVGAPRVIDKKLQDKKAYIARVRQEFKAKE